MTGNGRTFEPGEILVIKAILKVVYDHLKWNQDEKGYADMNNMGISISKDEYISLQSALDKLGIAIY